MEITHTWKITKLVQKNDGTGTVIQVFYKVHSTDGEHFYVSAGNVELDANIQEWQNFIPYVDLTEEIVIEWVKSKLGPDLGNHEQINTDQINLIKNPPTSSVIIKDLPWIV